VLAARADQTRSAKRRDSRLDFPASHAQLHRSAKKKALQPVAVSVSAGRRV
jgi:hypothetical protein